MSGGSFSLGFGEGGEDEGLKGRDERVFYVCDCGGGVLEFELHGGDGAADQAAGDDELVVGHIGRDVEGEAVHGDPFADAHAAGRDFGAWGSVGIADPDTGGTFFAADGDCVGGAGVDDGLFEESHVGVEAEVEKIEIEDGVADDLAGTVVGDVAAAVGFGDFDTGAGEHVGRGEQVGAGFGAAADGDDGGMLNEENGSKKWLGGFSRGEDSIDFGDLAFVGLGVGHGAEMDDGEIHGRFYRGRGPTTMGKHADHSFHGDRFFGH